MDIGTTFQQYQKVERCYNRIFAEQLISICNNRKWDLAVLDKTAQRNYYGEEPIPFVVDSIERGN